eukprot:8124602-Alexandrium_andersonii.AAC.1
MKSPRIANALQIVQLLRPRQLLREFALEQVQAADSPQKLNAWRNLSSLQAESFSGTFRCHFRELTSTD